MPSLPAELTLSKPGAAMSSPSGMACLIAAAADTGINRVRPSWSSFFSHLKFKIMKTSIKKGLQAFNDSQISVKQCNQIKGGNSTDTTDVVVVDIITL